jgi:EAL domain-containing protein (putative c-di-GMP-specific phosphodiesterase class I)
LNQAAQNRRALEQDLRRVIELEQLELHYQPQVDVRTGDITGFEALLRWNHPSRGLVSPLDFIPLAEETGLIGEIGAWVLKEACREAMTWPNQIRVAVNVSPVQLRHRAIELDVAAALGASGLPASRLQVEITEAVLMDDTEDVIAKLTQIRETGVTIAIDDFGTGYSSLSYLRAFPFDKIKIDKSFVQDICSCEATLAIIRAVNNLATSLGVTITAEGVETKDQLALLISERCREVQGFLFSKPRPAHELPALLDGRQRWAA